MTIPVRVTQRDILTLGQFVGIIVTTVGFWAAIALIAGGSQ